MVDQMTHRAKRHFFALATCSLLAACGGGSGTAAGDGTGSNGGPAEVPTSDSYIALNEVTSAVETPLGFVAMNSSNRTARGYAGTLDHNTGTLSGNGALLIGSVNIARTLVSLPGGETAELSNPGNTASHARIFRTNGLSNDLFGVVGQYTNLDLIPAMASSIYNGSVTLQADNGNATFALVGDATITASWSGDGITSVFNNLDGTRNDGLGGGINVSDVGTVTISGATLNGSQFSGGTFSTTGDDLVYTGGGTQTHAGQFFGPDAQEVGGVFGLEKENELELSGVFVARR